MEKDVISLLKMKIKILARFVRILSMTTTRTRAAPFVAKIKK
jgi:hypothetical protein